MAGVKALVFDFGNVLIDLNYEKHFEAFRKIFPSSWPAADDYPEVLNSTLIKYEKGELSDDAFVWAFQQLNPEIQAIEIVNAWNKLIGEIPDARFEMLLKLSENYSLILLSNINAIHLRYIRQYLRKQKNIHDFENRFFSKVFYSHEIKMRKPQPEIYTFVETECAMDAAEIFFIDDKKENIDAARSLGWKVQIHNPEFEISEVIGNYLRDD